MRACVLKTAGSVCSMWYHEVHSSCVHPLHVSSDRLWLVDMEYCGVNYRGYDIADHFCEFAGRCLSSASRLGNNLVSFSISPAV